jgi:hypothetical protein
VKEQVEPALTQVIEGEPLVVSVKAGSSRNITNPPAAPKLVTPPTSVKVNLILLVPVTNEV